MAHSPRSSTFPQPPVYLSPRSANALISDLRPTQLHPQALHYLNVLLDELVVLLISSARSLDTEDIKHVALTAVFGGQGGARGLGRTAISEAEIELRSWMAAQAGRLAMDDQPDVVKDEKDFPLEQAVALLRAKIVSFSTLAAQTPNPDLDARLLQNWQAVGGDPSEQSWAPASLYVTAIIEHVCEHVLANVGRVVARDSSIAVATLQDLYVALCEDESIWGLFKRMEVKSAIEGAMRPSDRHRRAQSKHAASPASPTPSTGTSPIQPPSASAKTFGTRSPSLDSMGPSASRGPKSSNGSSNANAKPSFDGSGPGIAHIATPPPSSRGIRGIMGSKHERSPSVLSNNTRSTLGAYDDAYGEDTGAKREREQDNEADFDALVKSGETMKVSLTPSRLKNFETVNQRTPTTLAARPSNSQSHRELSSRVLPAPTSGLRSSPSMGAMGPRLVPRDMPVSEESGPDDELLSKPKRRKESLIELLNSDPPWKEPEGTSPRKGSGGKAAAMLGAVPLSGSVGSPVRSREASPRSGGQAAVMLGTPTPPTATSSAPSIMPRVSSQRKLQARDDARSPLDDEENDFSFGEKPRKKSSAQELMDFLENTPPPLPPVAETSSTASIHGFTASRKDSRFKSLVHKLTGSREKEREKERDRTTSTVTALQAPNVRRQRSMQNTAQPAKPYEPADPVSRQPSRPTELTVRVVSGHELRVPEVASAVSSGANIERKNSKLRKSPSFERSLRPTPPVLGASIPIEDHYIGPTTNDAVVTSRDRPISGAPLMANVAKPNVGLGMQGVDLHRQESSSVVKTESVSGPSERGSEETPAFSTSDHEIPTPTQLIEQRLSVVTTPVPPPAAKAHSPPETTSAELTLKLGDLVPLRGLLDHAASARECRLLLSAILSQWGVPNAETASPVTPESRVAAWLLAGREGPVNAVSPTSVGSQSITPSTMPEVEAPSTQTDSYESASVVDDARRSMDRSDEELLYEFTDATESLADLDLENGGSSTEVRSVRP